MDDIPAECKSKAVTLPQTNWDLYKYKLFEAVFFLHIYLYTSGGFL
jgi:hypothetical protein